MSDKLRRDDLQEMSADELLELDVDELAEVGFQIAPAAVYNAEVGTEIVTRQMQGNDTQVITVKCTLTDMVEFIEGPEKETAEEMADEEGNMDLPEFISFSYPLPDGLNRFKTDWAGVVKESNGGEKISVGQMIESLNGLSVEFTHTIYRKKDNDGNPVKYSNVKNASLLTV